MDGSEVLEAEGIGTASGVAQTGFFHENSSSRFRLLAGQPKSLNGRVGRP
jgi:hypothetical protein